MKEAPSKNRFLIIAVLAVILAVIVFLYIDRNAVYAEMNNLKLIPQPQRFTELYFNDYAALPKVTVANQPFSFAFTIHNLEGTTTTYLYSVDFVYPDGDEIIFQNASVTLPNNASTSITVNHTFQTSNLTGDVVVDLTNLNQKIDFILPNTNP